MSARAVAPRGAGGVGGYGRHESAGGPESAGGDGGPPGDEGLSENGGPASGDGTVGILDAPPTEPIKVPLAVGAVLIVCAAFTIFAGVSSPVIEFAKHATMLF